MGSSCASSRPSPPSPCRATSPWTSCTSSAASRWTMRPQPTAARWRRPRTERTPAASVDELQPRQLGVESALRKQLLVGALGHDTALVHHHDAIGLEDGGQAVDRKSTRLNSSHVKISYAVF